MRRKHTKKRISLIKSAALLKRKKTKQEPEEAPKDNGPSLTELIDHVDSGAPDSDVLDVVIADDQI